jgi:phenylalanyl-tRNA synthetase beta subunit
LATASNEAFATGQAVRELEITIQLLSNQEMVPGPIASLYDVGERLGMRFGHEVELFDLERISTSPPLIVVRHRPSGAVVALTPDYRITYREGRVTVKGL